MNKKKKMTARRLFKSDKVLLLNDEVLAIQEVKENKRLAAEKEKMDKSVSDFYQKKLYCEKVLASKLEPKHMTNAQLKAVVSFKKCKGDAVIPSKEEFLIKRFNETHLCPDLDLQGWLEQCGMPKSDDSSPSEDLDDIMMEEEDCLLL